MFILFFAVTERSFGGIFDVCIEDDSGTLTNISERQDQVSPVQCSAINVTGALWKSLFATGCYCRWLKSSPPSLMSGSWMISLSQTAGHMTQADAEYDWIIYYTCLLVSNSFGIQELLFNQAKTC